MFHVLMAQDSMEEGRVEDKGHFEPEYTEHLSASQFQTLGTPTLHLPCRTASLASAGYTQDD